MLDIWNLDKDPYEGNCFALLVVRDDGSNENMIQKLRFPLRKGIQYEMSFYLAWADDMESVSPESRDMKVDFGNPLDLKFWISKKKKKSLLIYEAEQVKSIDWERHSIIITPDTDINYFWIESAHSPNIGFSYNGNILIDQIQIIKVD
jgi:hypothetical protein